jgi:radical SAM/Cys-rich protein
MSREVAERVIALLAAHPQLTTLDITGGAPELCASFRSLVVEARRLGRTVIDRCNLTILLEPGQETLADFLREHRVHVIASMPCYTQKNVDAQRGHGVFDKSIAALRILNARGYGRELPLDLVYNPGGAFLPGAQAALETDYRRELGAFGVTFSRLLTLANMPIARFGEQLARDGKADAYRRKLEDGFNPATVDGLMCRTMLSVDYTGALYDCDFNQMLGMRMRPTIFDVDLANLPRIATASHCFGCTAGAGSSCGGALT